MKFSMFLLNCFMAWRDWSSYVNVTHLDRFCPFQNFCFYFIYTVVTLFVMKDEFILFCFPMALPALCLMLHESFSRRGLSSIAGHPCSCRKDMRVGWFNVIDVSVSKCSDPG